MRCHKFGNEAPLMTQSPEMQQQSNIQDTSVVYVGQPPCTGNTHSPVVQGSIDGFHGRAKKTKKFGIAIVIIGIVTFLLGIIAMFSASQIWSSSSASGVWSGLFSIIAGFSITGAGYHKSDKCLRMGALVICIIALVLACISGVINLIAFGDGITCNMSCNYDYRGYYCRCQSKDESEGATMLLFVGLLNVVVVIICVMAAINLTNGCCQCSTCSKCSTCCSRSSLNNKGDLQKATSSYNQQNEYQHQQAYSMGPVHSQQQPQLQHPTHTQQETVYVQQTPVSPQHLPVDGHQQPVNLQHQQQPPQPQKQKELDVVLSDYLQI